VLQVYFPTCPIGKNIICKEDQNYIERFEKSTSFQHFNPGVKATRKSNHQRALVTRSFLMFRHLMKAVTAALTKRAFSNAKVVHSEGRF